ncbi:MAG: AIR synthase related protein, partial [Planctomycetaceae bacterium]
PLKYDGLSYTEIWISEAQERMVLAVPPEHWNEFESLCRSEGVEATSIGEFQPTGRLALFYHGEPVADLSMQFLHAGRPPVVREAVYRSAKCGMRSAELKKSPHSDHSALRTPHSALSSSTPHSALRTPHLEHSALQKLRYDDDLLAILGSLNVCSKEWIIRQYDHEVQGGSVVKPLVGAESDGPSDAAVVRPDLRSLRGLVIACGMNPRYGDLDPYWMAASAIDEAVRNCVAVGADPARIAILDNFCWGNTERPETLGGLVRAALGCRDIALAYRTPFISGKDSLNNEFTYQDRAKRQAAVTIAVPPSLLISALGQIADVRQAVTMDLKEPGSSL